MEWLVILLGVIAKEAMPYIIALIQKLFDRIGGMATLAERKAARKEVTRVIRQNLRKKPLKREWKLRTSEETLTAELEALLSKYEAKA